MNRIWRDFRRQWRLSEFRLLGAALILVSMAMTAISAVSDRVEQGLAARTSAIFGADALIESTRPLPPEYQTLAAESGLEVATSISFMSMLITEDGSRLSGVRAVSENYPLRGEVVLKGEAGGTRSMTQGPARGTVWLATQLAGQLRQGESSVELGDLDFVPRGEILLEPGGGAGMLRLAPRVMLHLDDLPATGLLTPASRARFRLLLAGDPDKVQAFSEDIQAVLEPYEELEIADIRQGDVQGTIGRVVSYLRLAVLLSVILAVVAMSLAAQGLWRRQSHEVALLRCLGLASGPVLRQLSLTYLFAAMPVILLGVLLGYGLQHVAVNLIESSTGYVLPAANLVPLIVAALIALVSLFAVMMPTLVSLRQVPAISVLRTRQSDQVSRNKSALFSIAILIAGIAILLARDLTLALSVMAGLAGAAILMWLLLRGFIMLTGRMVRPRSSPLYLSFKSITSNSGRSAWLISAFASTVFALFLLAVVRADLFEAWERSVPQDAPNLFLINIKPDSTNDLAALLADSGVESSGLFPIIRGRIVEIDGKSLEEKDFGDEQARRRVNHEFNLTELADLPAENTLVEGAWFKPGDIAWSLEEGTAELLDIELGGELAMDIAGQIISAPVTSIRSVRWDTMRPNFFIIASDGLLASLPRNFITSVYVQDDRATLIERINRQFPGVTAIDLDMLLQRFRDLAGQASAAVGAVFVFTMIAAVLVLLGVLQGQRSARVREIALYKTLGAGNRAIRQTVVTEFLILGGLAGALGAGLGLLSGWLLATEVFEFAYYPSWLGFGFTTVLTAALVAIAGFGSVRTLFGVLPVRLLSK